MVSLDEFSNEASLGELLDSHLEAWDLAEADEDSANALFHDNLFRLGLKILESLDRIEKTLGNDEVMQD